MISIDVKLECSEPGCNAREVGHVRTRMKALKLSDLQTPAFLTAEAILVPSGWSAHGGDVFCREHAKKLEAP